MNDPQIADQNFPPNTEHNFFYFRDEMNLTVSTAASVASNKHSHIHRQTDKTDRLIDGSIETSPFMVVVYKGRHGANLDSVRVVG